MLKFTFLFECYLRSGSVKMQCVTVSDYSKESALGAAYDLLADSFDAERVVLVS